VFRSMCLGGKVGHDRQKLVELFDSKC
jgi:hypothetical protein